MIRKNQLDGGFPRGSYFFACGVNNHAVGNRHNTRGGKGARALHFHLAHPARANFIYLF
jgi:hypothetical protein